MRTTYDASGFPVTVDTGTLPGETDSAWQSFAPVETVTRQFDVAGRVTQSALSAGGIIYAVHQMSYDAAGQVDCVATRMDPSGFGAEPASACMLGTESNYGLDRIAKYFYDGAGRVTSVTNGYGTSDATTERAMTYYPGGALHTLTDGNGQTTSYAYDPYGRLADIYYPDPTTVGASSATDYEAFGHDANSNIISIRRRSGDVIETPHDALGRITARILPGDSADSVYFSYDNQGRMLSALYGDTAGNGITQTYDGLGRLQTRTAFGKPIGYAYDLAGRLVQLTYPDGYAVSYGYTNANELQSVVDSTGTTLATYAYDALGGLLQISRPNNTVTGYSRTGIELLAGLTQDLSGTGYDTSASFGYNPAGEIVSKTQSNDAAYTWLPNPPNSTVSASYDGANRLTTFNGANVIEDANGDVQSGVNGMSYAYDALGQLRQATSSSGTVSLAYGPLGLLHTETNGSTTTEYVYDGRNLIAEYVNGTLADRFVYGSNPGPLVWYQGSGTSSPIYLHADERGSIITASDVNGVATGSVKYSSYGESASLVSPFGYAGQLYLPDLQLYYDRARMYSPQTGRFMQPDPIGYASDMNLYAYVGGDPVNAEDFSGMTSNNDCAAAGLDCTGALPPFAGEVVVSGSKCAISCQLQQLLLQTELWILRTSGAAQSGQANGVATARTTAGVLPGAPQTNPTCASALQAAGQNSSAVSRALADWPALSSAAAANGIDPALLAAIGIRETGFQNVWQAGAGWGAGVFQIDLGENPGVGVSQAFNVIYAANYAAGVLASNEAALSARYPNFTGMQLLQATAASYNFGIRNISGNPDTIDVGTAGNDYGSNVVGLMECFK